MPTKEDWEELLNNCKCEWTVMNNDEGYKITGKNGKFIFLPADGRCWSTKFYHSGEYGFYWSSTVISGTETAYRFRFDPTGHNVGWHYRCQGLSVRPGSK